jgi:hypothetical protein
VDQVKVLERVRVAEAPAKLLDDVDRDVDREGRADLGAAVPDVVQVASRRRKSIARKIRSPCSPASKT